MLSRVPLLEDGEETTRLLSFFSEEDDHHGNHQKKITFELLMSPAAAAPGPAGADISATAAVACRRHHGTAVDNIVSAAHDLPVT